jgi:pyridoxal phosphate enzyme (YggS family)
MPATHDEILHNLDSIRVGIERAAERGGRVPEDVLIVAAAKTVRPEAVRWVVSAGVTAIGENYVSELRAAREAVEGARWHFIGTLQTNSAHHVAALADVVETLAAERSTTRLARRAAEAGRTLDALIEVDFTGERSGVLPEEVPIFASRVAAMEGVRLRGLMTLPPLGPDAEDARPWFRRLREIRDGLLDTHPEVLELSMGMSLDYGVAIEEGATMVRIGTALFGSRAT